jgi:hypothetical protein
MKHAVTYCTQALKRQLIGTQRGWLVGGFMLAVTVLLMILAHPVSWGEVFDTLGRFPQTALWPAAGLVILSYLIYTNFDVLARVYTGHSLSWRRVMAVAFVSDAFNLNLGLLIGGAGFRYRLYTRWGVQVGIVTRILGFSVISNWLGYLWGAGSVFAFGAIQVPSNWQVDGDGVRILGGGLLMVATTYLALCTLMRKRVFNVAGHEVRLPCWRMALLQSAMGAANWATMGLIIYVLFQQRVEYSMVLGTLMLAGITSAVAHIPGGLGVLEAVFVAMLAERVSASHVLGVLITYRVIYYLCPLGVAAAAYIAMEWTTRNPRKYLRGVDLPNRTACRAAQVETRHALGMRMSGIRPPSPCSKSLPCHL